MSDPFARSVATTFRCHGIDAVLDPDGVALAVKVLPARPDMNVDWAPGGVSMRKPTGMFEIQAGDWGSFGTGAILAIGAERRKVQDAEVRDPRRLKVMLGTVEVS